MTARESETADAPRLRDPQHGGQAPASLGYRCRPMSPSPAPRLRRAYFECRYGQLHVHNAIPAGGGFDELTTLICLHASSSTGRVFLEFSRLLGTSRSIYSPDTPGCGESDAPPRQIPVSGYAEALGDFLDSMRFRQVDLLGAHSGAAVAAEIAIARPKQVRRVVMVGAPALDARRAAGSQVTRTDETTAPPASGAPDATR